jgi:hypothetical protein
MRDGRAGEEIGESGQRLRGELQTERERAGGVRRWRCSEGLRERVVAYAVECAARRESHDRIAGRLGLAQETLSRWMREAAANSDFRQVAIVPSTGSRASEPAAEPMALRVITPRGFVVEGLDPELLVSLLRVLG